MTLDTRTSRLLHQTNKPYSIDHIPLHTSQPASQTSKPTTRRTARLAPTKAGGGLKISSRSCNQMSHAWSSSSSSSTKKPQEKKKSSTVDSQPPLPNSDMTWIEPPAWVYTKTQILWTAIARHQAQSINQFLTYPIDDCTLALHTPPTSLKAHTWWFHPWQPPTQKSLPKTNTPS